VTDVHLFGPQELYRHGEEGQWSPFEIDLSPDAEQWQALSGEDRGLIFWALSSLMVAEERITTKFSGLVGAYGSEEEATFLATQQVDEARHMQFYARYQDEVVADPAAIGAHVEKAREQISPAFRQIFDVALVEAHERLAANPGDTEAKVRFVTLYHQILEGTLGLTSFNFVTAYLERRRGPRPGGRAARDAARAAAGGGRVADASGPRGDRLERARRRRRGDPRLRAQRTDPPSRRRRSSPVHPLTPRRSPRWPTFSSSASTTPGARR
jgi:hypothetical protein